MDGAAAADVMQFCFLFCHKTSRCDFPNNVNSFDFVHRAEESQYVSPSTALEIRQRFPISYRSPIEFSADRMTNKIHRSKADSTLKTWERQTLKNVHRAWWGLLSSLTCSDVSFSYYTIFAVVFGTLLLSLRHVCWLGEGALFAHRKAEQNASANIERNIKYRFGSLRRIFFVWVSCCRFFREASWKVVVLWHFSWN